MPKYGPHTQNRNAQIRGLTPLSQEVMAELAHRYRQPSRTDQIRDLPPLSDEEKRRVAQFEENVKAEAVVLTVPLSERSHEALGIGWALLQLLERGTRQVVLYRSRRGRYVVRGSKSTRTLYNSTLSHALEGALREETAP